MIPVRLRLRNFMCYGEDIPPLDFRAFHIACLCGDNGNGKSALLDAITWALWGRARARADDELIRVGRNEMEVEFEFALGVQQYRVIRKRTRPGNKRGGQPILDLQVTSGDGYRSVAGNSIRETEQRIVEILRMDYETFINSAYLLQGRADEFTKKAPSQRKQILADILALSRYDDLEDRARARARAGEGRENVLESEIQAVEAELSHKGEYETQLREIGEAMSELDGQRRSQEEKAQALAKRKNELDVKGEQLREVEERTKQARETIASFEAQVRDHQRRLERYQAVLHSYPGELEKVHARLAELAPAEQELAAKRDLAQQTSNRIHVLKTSNARIKEEGEELRDKVNMLAQEEAKCPLCGTDLGVEARERIMADYEAQLEGKREAFGANEQEAKQLEGDLKTLQQEIERLERTLREGRAQAERREEALNRDRSDAEDSLPGEKQALAQAEEALSRSRSTLDEEEKRREALLREMADLPQLESGLGAAQKLLNETTERLAQAGRMLGAVQEKLQRCVGLEESRAEKRAELDAIVVERVVYEELAVAFSKRGIQALIIETALPEIEDEANRLLARMTDNCMQVKIETQRAYRTKKDESIETLDINISDELATPRRYETYSGGEAFRIDFALRIALSKVLARRVGAPLSTLIIDEGFGTQDSNGRGKLVDAINSIQDDFDKVLVITHIEELKEAFPARIEVSKTAAGSMIQVS